MTITLPHNCNIPAVDLFTFFLKHNYELKSDLDGGLIAQPVNRRIQQALKAYKENTRDNS